MENFNQQVWTFSGSQFFSLYNSLFFSLLFFFFLHLQENAKAKKAFLSLCWENDNLHWQIKCWSKISQFLSAKLWFRQNVTCIGKMIFLYYFLLKLVFFFIIFLFHLRSSLRFQDIHIFVFFPFLAALPRLKGTNRRGIIYFMNWLA